MCVTLEVIYQDQRDYIGWSDVTVIYGHNTISM